MLYSTGRLLLTGYSVFFVSACMPLRIVSRNLLSNTGSNSDGLTCCYPFYISLYTPLHPTQASLNFAVTNISAWPLWLKTVRVASAYLFPGVSMRLRVCHGIRGEAALTMDVVERTTLGWDIMKQTAKVLELDSPFQIVLYAASSSVIQSPLRAVQFDTDANETTFCYIVQLLQVPSAQQYRDLLTAICHKDVIDVSYLLGKGVGLIDMTTEERHISTLIASAILRDHSADPYAYQPAAGHCFPRHGATLTYLLLQAHADPNIIPPKTKPTTMLELAVELGSSQHVQILLEAGASVIPVKGALPPLFLAVLHRHRTNVQLLLDAQADPWQEITIASVLCHSLEWYGYPARKEVFNAVQAAAEQSNDDTVIDILQRASSPSDVVRSEQPSQVRIKLTALTDRATAIMKQIVWKYHHIIDQQSRQTNFTTYRWRKILDGLSLPVQLRPELQTPPELNQGETFLHQVD